MAALQNAQSAGAGSLKLCPGAGRPLVFVDELTASPFALDCLCWANPRSGTTDLTCPEPPGACADTQPNGWACSRAGEAAGEGGRGEVAAARALDEDTRSRRRRGLGADHPHILISADNLPIDMQMLGEGEPGGCCRNCCRRPNLLWSERRRLEVPALGGSRGVSDLPVPRRPRARRRRPACAVGRGLLYTGRVFSAARDRRNLLVLRLNP